MGWLSELLDPILLSWNLDRLSDMTLAGELDHIIPLFLFRP